MIGKTRRPGSWDPFGFGLIYTVDPVFQGTIAALPAPNAGAFHRVVGGGTISKIGLYVATASGTVSVAVYRNSGVGRSAVPDTRLATSGSIACPTAGYAEVSLGASVVVQPGDWFALSADNSTVTFRCASSADLISAVAAGRSARQWEAHPLPAAPVVSSHALRGFVLVGVA